MELRDFHTIRNGLKMNAPSAPASAVQAMERTLLETLRSSAVLHSAEVDSTDDPDRRLIAMVGFDPELSDVDVALELERLWAEHVHHAYWEAHALLADEDQVELQGGILVSRNGYHVTVHVVAQRREAPVRPEPVAPVTVPAQEARSRGGVLRRIFAPA